MSASDYLEVAKGPCKVIADKLFEARRRGGSGGSGGSNPNQVEVHLSREDLIAVLSVAYSMGAEHGEKVGRNEEGE